MAKEPQGTWSQVIIYFSVAAVAIGCLVMLFKQKPERMGYFYFPSWAVIGLLVACAVVLAIMRRRR